MPNPDLSIFLPKVAHGQLQLQLHLWVEYEFSTPSRKKATKQQQLHTKNPENQKLCPSHCCIWKLRSCIWTETNSLSCVQKWRRPTPAMGDVSHGSRMYTMSLNLLCARRERKKLHWKKTKSSTRPKRNLVHSWLSRNCPLRVKETLQQDVTEEEGCWRREKHFTRQFEWWHPSDLRFQTILLPTASAILYFHCLMAFLSPSPLEKAPHILVLVLLPLMMMTMMMTVSLQSPHASC